MKFEDLTLDTKNTWCPGCGNFLLFDALKKALISLEKKGEKRENFVLVTGIGCHGKIFDYINLNSFYGLHGRAIPLATGIKLGNKNLKVICSVGDGDTYSEGIAHLVHAAKRNSDITVIVHDNHNFALTCKQFTLTSPKGFVGSSTPEGNIENPLNPLELMLVSGATFIAREYVSQRDQLTETLVSAINHKGFSFVEVLQPCVAWFNTYEKYNERTYRYKKKSSSFNKKDAFSIIREWDYENGDKIPLGVFYQEKSASFEEQVLNRFDKKSNVEVKKLIK